MGKILTFILLLLFVSIPIYTPNLIRVYKLSNLYLLDNGNLKVEGCLLRVCGHEEWKPMDVIINEEDGTRSAILRE